MIPRTASTANPVDLTYNRDFAESFFDIPDVLLSEKDADMLLAYILSPGSFADRILKEMGVPEESIPLEREKLLKEHSRLLSV